VKNLAIS